MWPAYAGGEWGGEPSATECCSIPIDPVDWFNALPLSFEPPAPAPAPPVVVDVDIDDEPKAPVDPAPAAAPSPTSVCGPCEWGRVRAGSGIASGGGAGEVAVVTVTPPEVMRVEGMPQRLWPVMMTLLLSGGTGVT